MKRISLIASVLFACAVAGRADAGETVPFRVGEKLSYQIFWGPFVVGHASLEVAGLETVDGHECYHLIALAKTSGLTDALFPVNNKVESWLDTEGLFTRRYRENRSEGKHTRQDETRFDYEHHQTITTNFTAGKSTTGPLPGPVQDVISSVYYIRAQPLKLDAESQFLVNAVSTNLVVNVHPDQRKQLSIHPVGDVQALRLEPKPTLNVVAANKGHMWFWVSDDDRRLVLLLCSDMKIGSAKLVLSKIETAAPAPAAKPRATTAAVVPAASATPLAAKP